MRGQTSREKLPNAGGQMRLPHGVANGWEAGRGYRSSMADSRDGRVRIDAVAGQIDDMLGDKLLAGRSYLTLG